MDIGRLMLDGWSWSGRERDNLHLNVGNGHFVDASAASGLDFIEDGRSLATLDWDGDGRLDAFLRNRNAPGLRFLHGNAPREQHWVAVALRGVTSNRDAIGARITLRSGGRTFTRELRAGDGYLAQGSKVLHFGLGAVTTIESMRVRWPSGLVQDHAALAVDTRYLLTEGSPPSVLSARAVSLPLPTDVLVPARPAQRMVLRTPLPLPPHMIAAEKSPAGGATAIVIPGSDALSNLTLLEEVIAAPEGLRSAELHLALLAAKDDPLAERLGRALPAELASVRSASTRSSWRAIHQNLLGPAKVPDAPCLFLVDSAGLLQSIWWGHAAADALLRDATLAALGNNSALPRASFPGRWYYGHLPDIAGLAAALRQTKDGQAVGFYVLLAEDLRRRTKPR